MLISPIRSIASHITPFTASTIDIEANLSAPKHFQKISLSSQKTESKGVKIWLTVVLLPSDLEARQSKNSPPDFPFGVFIYFFILMTRVSTGYRSHAEILKNVDLAKHVYLLVSECIILGTFEFRLPSLLGKSSTVLEASSTLASYLPAL